MIREMRIYKDKRLPEPVPANNTFPTFLFTLPKVDDAVTAGIESIICESLECGLTHWPCTGRWFTSVGIEREKTEVWMIATEREHDLKRLVKDISLDLGEKEVFFLTLGTHEIL